VETKISLRGRLFCLGEVWWILLWRRLREDPLKGLPEELRLRRRMFRERLRKGLLKASRKRLREARRRARGYERHGARGYGRRRARGCKRSHATGSQRDCGCFGACLESGCGRGCERCRARGCERHGATGCERRCARDCERHGARGCGRHCDRGCDRPGDMVRWLKLMLQLRFLGDGLFLRVLMGGPLVGHTQCSCHCRL
jgi:hypothetical protein